MFKKDLDKAEETEIKLPTSLDHRKSKRIPEKYLLLLLSRLSHVQLCVTPWTAAYQAPLSLGFSKQEYWSGLPLPSPAFSRHPHKAPHSIRKSTGGQTAPWPFCTSASVHPSAGTCSHGEGMLTLPGSLTCSPRWSPCNICLVSLLQTFSDSHHGTLGFSGSLAYGIFPD